VKKGQNHGLNGLKDDTDYSTSEKSEAIKSVQSVNPCKSVIQTGYKQTEVGVIPEDWEVTTLQEVCVPSGLVRGPFGGTLKKEMFVKEGKKVYEQRNAIYRDQTIGNYFITDNKYSELKRFSVIPGEFIVSCSGTIGRIYKIPVGAQPGVINQALLKIKINNHFIDADYFYYYFDWEEFQKRIVDNTHGGAMQNLVGMSVFKAVEVARPPLPEQRAIAAALSDVDALLAKLDQLIAKKRNLKQATMQQLLTGQTRLPGFSEEWEVRWLGECLTAQPDYGINAPAVPYSDRLPVYIRITDISEDGRFAPEGLVSVNSPTASQYYLNIGDLVFARTGASVGKSYLYNEHDGPLIFAGFLIRVRPDITRLIPAFLATYVETSRYWNWVRMISMRSGQPGINGNEFAKLPIPLPSLLEQTAIATILSDMDAEIAALKARRDKTRALKQGMMQELLTGRIRLV
jgi:type I restriction enzyme S subunit